MDRIIFGDNQFFGVNHISDEKSRQQAIKFKDDRSILRTLDIAREHGIETFMCTTHDRIANICNAIRSNPLKYQDFKIYPCMPYAHKYANAVTELGILGAMKEHLPGNMLGSMLKGGMALMSKDVIKIMELMIDSEMKMFRGIRTPVIFLQNVITDLLLGLGMTRLLFAVHRYIQTKYHAEAGFITMNLPKLLDALDLEGIRNPIVCSSINKVGFRMAGGNLPYEQALQEREFRGIAMQILAGGAISAKESVEYVCALPNIESILFGASTETNIAETVNLIHVADHHQQLIKSKPAPIELSDVLM